VRKDAWVELDFVVELPDDDEEAERAFSMTVEEIQAAVVVLANVSNVTVVGAETRYEAAT
jgi:hypothetical protein